MDQDTREVRDEIEEAREHLGETVEALTYKMNAPKRVKERASASVHEVKTRAAAAVDDVRERVEDAKDQVEGAKATTARGRAKPVVATVKRHPKTTVAAAVGIAVGFAIGRTTGRS